MEGLFGKVDNILDEEFDRYMELFRPTETEFYIKYFAARFIKDRALGKGPHAAGPRNGDSGKRVGWRRPCQGL